ncbi:hypothetical protein [Demequina lignilytica]|uniref:Uncharacterized protein n=1 Tax=Demequina lignilytica TaxID=3051663 RepID=A0AB35MJN5_9MICO|nr:hypothetical protein [Demequina sp. SYSU T0a273]MDN4483888.1 hypothetical protein [Demequina sp. SYSU T0a273]
MRAVVTILVTLVLVAIGWFWWRSDTLGSAPEVRAAAEMPLPVITGDFERSSGECVDTVAWASVHARPWQALSQSYSGALDVCVEVYRNLDAAGASDDSYVALVTGAWSTGERVDSWWPWEGRDDQPDPILVRLTLDPAASGEAYAASDPTAAACSATVPFAPVALEDASAVTEPPTFISGTCGGDAVRGRLAADGVSWTLSRPEEWDVTVLSYGFEVPAGASPQVSLEVDRVGVEG